MTNWQPDERFLDFIIKKSESDKAIRDLVGTIKPFSEDYDVDDLIDEMAEGTEIGQRLYASLYQTHEREFKEFLGRKVKLYDPHPGFVGAAVPLPEPMKELADKLDGLNMSLEDALDNLSPVAEELGGFVRLVEDGKYIRFGYKKESGKEHSFRLLSYELITD